MPRFFENLDDKKKYNSSDNEEGFEWEDGYFNKKSLFQILVDNIKNLKPSKRLLTYHGNSDRTKRRKRKSIHEAIKANGQTLDKFFILNKNDDEREEGNGDDEREGNGDDKKEKGSDELNNQLLDEYILKIENKLKTNKKITSGQKFLKCVQTWAKSYALYDNILQIGRGKYPGKSLIDNEDIWLKILSYLRKVKYNVIIQSFCDYVLSEILPSLGIETKTTIRYQKEMYVDGHERPDVVEYRKQFFERISMYQNLMPTFENIIRRLKLNNDQIKEVGNSMYHEVRVMINPELSKNMKPLTPKTCDAIVYGHNCEQSSYTIAKQLGCGKTTVNDILKRFHKTHSLTPKKQTGRPPLLNSPAQQ
ncbi:hypothetical protein GLOIN_2v1785032 [Rhizophagus irregularis DAOM 181602=DAOM 197198]|uniref:Uncharacterized protein n=2 Tax=Rhizophagus irregularis TaxID=588596 RepID=A0A2P4PB72_RHIID|nr:hypothetical protein GLOIN_2v1785032 [Rhizophagus irregularis DAOM 181602=DAOM 197198]POG62630.1 hypothetical protein GLOIN_2v1785032 [Rhizophagus irregularis DAOM 181602=DAOM 197198]|eukprot:XP_025169496.1 hypothetical protein GLOIN_2v1785032 [Rhizophagus irregularis DAOM 181602=DAOM 197198]